MVGVEILSQYSEVVCISWYTPFLLTLAFVGAALSLYAFILSLKDGFLFGMPLSTFFIVLFVFCFIYLIKPTETGKIIYKATVSDEVKFNEFYEKYEIIEQDGKIFALKERDEDK